MSFQVQFSFLIAVSKTQDFFLLGELRMCPKTGLASHVPPLEMSIEHLSTPTDAHKLRVGKGVILQKEIRVLFKKGRGIETGNQI